MLSLYVNSSGVQRFFGDNEVLGCPGQDKFQNCFCSRRKSTYSDKFLNFSKKFNWSSKISDDFFGHLPFFFFYKTGLLDAPSIGCLPGPSHHPHPLCTPLVKGLMLFLCRLNLMSMPIS